MTQKNETPILILALLITAALLGGGFWFFRDKIPGLNNTSNPSQQSQTNTSQGQRSSLGGTILIGADTTPQKQAGVAAFAQGNYSEAIAQFQASLKTQPNDPETLIYLNNAQVATQNPLKIAVVVPIGGTLNVAKEILRGVAQGQNEVNKQGGINNRGLQVEIFNDDNNPEIAPQVAQELVKDSSILAVVGHNSSDATLAAAPEYQKGGLVMITPTSTATEISELGDYIFRTVPSIRFEADTLSRYVVRTAKKTNIAICSDSKAKYSQSFKENFTSAIYADGGKITEVNCDLSAASFNPSAITSQAISNGADGVLLLPSIDRLNLAIEVAKANQQRLALFGGSTLYTIQTIKEGQNTVNGMVLTVPWHSEAFAGNSFPQQARQLWGGDVSWRSALAYDAISAIITGLKQGEITRQGLQQTLSNLKFSSKGATGEIKFLPSGDRNGAVILVKVEANQSSKSGTGFDFVPIKSP